MRRQNLCALRARYVFGIIESTAAAGSGITAWLPSALLNCLAHGTALPPGLEVPWLGACSLHAVRKQVRVACMWAPPPL